MYLHIGANGFDINLSILYGQNKGKFCIGQYVNISCNHSQQPVNPQWIATNTSGHKYILDLQQPSSRQYYRIVQRTDFFHVLEIGPLTLQFNGTSYKCRYFTDEYISNSISLFVKGTYTIYFSSIMSLLLPT